MSEFKGIVNQTDKPQKLVCNAIIYCFQPGGVRVLEGAVAAHALKKLVLHDNTFRHVFKVMPLEDALKHPKREKDALISAAEKEAEKQNALREKLKAEIIAELGLKPDGRTASGFKK